MRLSWEEVLLNTVVLLRSSSASPSNPWRPYADAWSDRGLKSQAYTWRVNKNTRACLPVCLHLLIRSLSPE
jgi:hypothetical protein